MGLFDSLVSGALKSVLQQGDSSQVGGLLSQILGKTDLGSLGGLLSQLQQGGLGGEVSSWLSNGHNMPVSQDQLKAALGNEQLQQMARSMGLPVDALLAMLSQQLPGAVDKMSPNGALEESDAAPESNDGGREFGGAPAGNDAGLGDQAGLNDIKA
jgi:uncharacterized protein YidB (DUF937 family)